MGVAFLWSACYACGAMMSCNPNRVPSLRDADNVRQPICQSCITRANTKRVELGLPAFEISPDAYEPVDETEL